MTDCNEAVRPVHDRMPVLLQEEDYDLWLRGSLDDVMVSQGRCFPDQLIKLENGGDRADGGPASLSAANAIATNL